VNNEIKAVAIYSRKSKFTGKGESIENQIELCREYAKAHFDIKNDKIYIYEDEGFSGGNTDRPQFKNMIRDAKSKKFNAIICYRLDRISRNIVDFSILINELSNLNIAFVSIKELFDTSSPMGRAMMYISSIFSQLERETTAERIRDNMIELAKSGRWLGGNTPTGYKSEGYEKVSIDGKTRKAFKLASIEEEKRLVKLIFNKYLELKSQTKLETYLIQNNIRTKTGKTFTRFAIKNILENLVYVKADNDMYKYFEANEIDLFARPEDFDSERGIMAYNKTSQKNKKTTRKRLIEEWIIAVGKHEGFISGDDWLKVQEILNKNQDKRYRTPRQNHSLLSGILRCKKCGSYMRPKLTKFKDENDNFKFTYMCELKEKSRRNKCDCANINGIEADKMVMETVKKFISPTSDLYNELKEIANSIETEDETIKEEIKSLKSSYNKNQTEIDSLLEKIKIIDSDLIADISKEIKKLRDINTDIQNKINDIVAANQKDTIDRETAEIIFDIVKNYSANFDKLDTLQKRSLLKLLLNSVETDGENLIVNFFGNKTAQDCRSLIPLCEHFK
jgi:site-specific DNA recombinase